MSGVGRGLWSLSVFVELIGLRVGDLCVCRRSPTWLG